MQAFWKDALLALKRSNSFALLFPGQGTLYEGMTLSLQNTFPHIVRPLLTKARQLCADEVRSRGNNNNHLPSIMDAILQQRISDVPLEKLVPTEIAQPIIFLNSFVHFQCVKVIADDFLL